MAMRRGLAERGVTVVSTDVLSRRYFRGDMMYGSAPEPLGSTRHAKEASARQAVKAAKRRRFAALRSASTSFCPVLPARGTPRDVASTPPSTIRDTRVRSALPAAREIECAEHLVRLCSAVDSDTVSSGEQVVCAENVLAALTSSSHAEAPANSAADFRASRVDDQDDDVVIDDHCGDHQTSTTDVRHSEGADEPRKLALNTSTSHSDVGQRQSTGRWITERAKATVAAGTVALCGGERHQLLNAAVETRAALLRFRQAPSGATIQVCCSALDGLADVIELLPQSAPADSQSADALLHCVQTLGLQLQAASRAELRDVELSRRTASLAAAIGNRLLRFGLPLGSPRSTVSSSYTRLLGSLVHVVVGLRHSLDEAAHPAFDAVVATTAQAMVLDVTSVRRSEGFLGLAMNTTEAHKLPKRTLWEAFVDQQKPIDQEKRINSIAKLIRTIVMARQRRGQIFEDSPVANAQTLGSVARSIATNRLMSTSGATVPLAHAATEVAYTMSLVQCTWNGTRTFVRLVVAALYGIDAPAEWAAPPPEQLGFNVVEKVAGIAVRLGIGAPAGSLTHIRHFVHQQRADGRVAEARASKVLDQLAALERHRRQTIWQRRLRESRASASETAAVSGDDQPTATRDGRVVVIRMQRSDPFERWGFDVLADMTMRLHDGDSAASRGFSDASRLHGNVLRLPRVVAVDGKRVADANSMRAALFGRLGVAVHVEVTD
uniref:Uncharacterized protein n=1 Tax=Neobodo designis TaxID=312471 RepID=A0A7S1M2V8_NEODS|mmetsp:Transcript_33252/g.102665  ORF Transcript_33252/g.102665 Transcript_33252/m.102665 type:complete len:721 (+) Transcript_33252:31-2193(+)|eukprot:CAMPEP_0174848094 /NCGR_PEP_ID=MMETSP1114-20130205/13308_1 /TAXON_ID=312471 /ORGANISM="Neobodo designis, Strain CCAP 1951/1" /LENGTH=720 /DNA_ID=CAMNT_0016082393 /DNA_START=29 /DNA_END=2191 /DNA_ORIENTATION=+